MAAKSSLLNMVLCLTAVCLVCSALLGATYAVTAEPIEQASRKALVAAISQVLPEGGEISEAQTAEFGGQNYEYYTQNVGGQTSAWAIKSTTSGFGGALTVLVGVGVDGKIYSTKVLSHSETPGLGAKCQTDQGFLSQFQGLDPSVKVIKVTKDGGNIDAITASTITSRAYALAVANAVEVAKTLKPENTEE